MRGLVFAQSVNKKGRCDARGAFIPGARAFTKAHGLRQPVWLDDRNDRQTLIDTIASARDLDVIAYFGHGTEHGLPSADIGARDVNALADAIRSASGPCCQVILYACSAGKPDCFASRLANLLNNRVTVWGHSTVGHSFTNPFVTRFPYGPDTTPFLIDPHGPLWDRWHGLIKGASDIWSRFPFLSKRMVEAEVQSGTRQAVIDPRALDL